MLCVCMYIAVPKSIPDAYPDACPDDVIAFV